MLTTVAEFSGFKKSEIKLLNKHKTKNYEDEIKNKYSCPLMAQNIEKVTIYFDGSGAETWWSTDLHGIGAVIYGLKSEPINLLYKYSGPFSSKCSEENKQSQSPDCFSKR